MMNGCEVGRKGLVWTVTLLEEWIVLDRYEVCYVLLVHQ